MNEQAGQVPISGIAEQQEAQGLGRVPSEFGDCDSAVCSFSIFTPGTCLSILRTPHGARSIARVGELIRRLAADLGQRGGKRSRSTGSGSSIGRTWAIYQVVLLLLAHAKALRKRRPVTTTTTLRLPPPLRTNCPPASIANARNATARFDKSVMLRDHAAVGVGVGAGAARGPCVPGWAGGAANNPFST